MRFTYHRRSLLFALCFILLIAGALLFCKTRQIPALAPAKLSEMIILDAGHGGADGGAVSAHGVVESYLNLEIARSVEAMFHFLGQATIMTRTGEDGLYDPDSITIRQKKVADTRNRVKLINSYENATLISIHQNSMPTAPNVRGAQVFYNTSPHAQELAHRIQATLNTGINAENEKQEARISSSVYLMSHADCDAVLIECGFLSNPEEEKLLQQSHYQRKLAVAIVSGYLNN